MAAAALEGSSYPVDGNSLITIKYSLKPTQPPTTTTFRQLMRKTIRERERAFEFRGTVLDG